MLPLPCCAGNAVEATVHTVGQASEAAKVAVGVAKKPRVVQGAALAALGAAQLVSHGMSQSLAMSHGQAVPEPHLPLLFVVPPCHLEWLCGMAWRGWGKARERGLLWTSAYTGSGSPLPSCHILPLSPAFQADLVAAPVA